MRRLPSVSEMEHITAKEFGEKMDAVLERVSKEDIALIIEYEDKSYVLCPARWFELPELKQMEVMVKNAVRYVAEVDDPDLTETLQIVEELAPVLSKECIVTLLEIIKSKVPNNCSEWHAMKQITENALLKMERGEAP